MTLINLLPAHRKQALRCRGRLRIWLGAFLAYSLLLATACVAARLAWGAGADTDERQLHSSSDRIRQTDTSLAVVRKELASLHERQRVVTTLTAQPEWADFLRLIGDRLGPNLVLRDLRLQELPGAPAGPSASLAPKHAPAQIYKLEMRGLGKAQTDVSKYVAALEATALFDEVRLLRTNREPFLAGSATSFELECRFHDQGGQ